VIRNSEEYKTQSIHYLENAFKSIKAGNPEKAGEFLWGSMAQALKAVAASRERELNTHEEIRRYARSWLKEAEMKAYGMALVRLATYIAIFMKLDLAWKKCLLTLEG
jgi:hypothetical protein